MLWQCFGWFQKRLADSGLEGEALARLLSDTVARQLLFILITVEDDISAYTVFETLNARGLELSSTDLLKNCLFSRVPVRSDLVALQRRWHHMIGIVKHKRFPDFLSYHLLCQSPHIRKQRLFKKVREEVKTSVDVFALMDALEQRADLFAAMDDTAHEFWMERTSAKPYVRDLQLFGVRQHTPLVFAAWDRMSADDFTHLLKLLCVLSVRYTVIGSLNTNELEPSINRQCHNGSFEAKKALYGQSRYVWANVLGQEDQADWSPATLALRQERMAKRAAHVWRSDFD